jgi:hypothetical protein
VTTLDGRGSSLRSASYNQLLGAWTSICVSPQAGLGLPSCPRTTSSSNSRQGVHPMVKHRVVGCPPRDGASPGAWGGGVTGGVPCSEPELVRRTGASPARHAMRSLSLSLSTRRATLFDGRPAARPCRRSGLRVRASAERAAPLTPFPLSYRQVVLQCQQSVQAALTDGMKLVEVRLRRDTRVWRCVYAVDERGWLGFGRVRFLLSTPTPALRTNGLGGAGGVPHAGAGQLPG